MIIAIAAAFALLFGVITGEQDLAVVKRLEERVPEVITDKAKAKAALEHAGAMESIAGEAHKAVNDVFTDWVKEDEDHATDRSSLRASIGRAKTVREAARKELLDELFEMKSKMTKEQWEAIFSEKGASQ